jgi:two-component system, NtrC family, sensor kinase
MSLKKAPFVGLRAHFMILAVLLTLFSSLVWGGLAWHREKALLEDRVSREGRMLVSAMAIPVINALLYQELGILEEGGLLDTFVTDIMANRQLHPRYAMVVDPHGRVLSHNRLAEYGTFYGDPLTREMLVSNSILETPLVYEGEQVLDFAIPLAIAGKRWGGLRVGVSLEPLKAEFQALATRIVTFAILFSVGSLVIYYIVGSRLARPLIVLAEHMEEVRDSAFPPASQPVRRDEIGQLQNSFYRMLERLHRSEKERRASLERVLEEERRTRMIVYGVAHEVNNPLAGIEGALFQIDQKGGARVARYSMMIRESLDRVGKIVSQLLDLARAGTLNKEGVDSRYLFEDLAVCARMALREGGCHLEVEDLCSRTKVLLDRDKIHQVVLNLILNAQDALGGKGVISFQAFYSDGFYCLKVEDDGPGIPEKVRARIFEPFFTTKKAGKGSGMGLAISRSIVENHGGILEVVSDEGKGTAFTVRIPYALSGEQAHGKIASSG